jgi:pSer/pThr/pTyr-binding forkhead associated (FHA) protein
MAEDTQVQVQQGVRVALEVVSGPHQGARFEFDRHDTFLVGRGSWSHLCLRDDLHFSRHHFRIEIRPPDCYLVDLGSRNGTFVNGNRVNATFLRDGDVISGGKTEIRVSVASGQRRVVADAPTVLGAFKSTITFDKPAGARSDKKLAAIREIPGYQLEEEIGGGSMGVVYRAIHAATAKPVAIKVISPRQSASEAAMQLFVREASLLGRLNHPHIVQCLDFGYSAGQLYMIMEYVPAISSESVLAEQYSARTRVACAIICQVLQALEHAHGMSVVHRDIKPENVLLWRKGRKLHAKLADFGLAKNYAYAGLSEISRMGDIRGTIAYLAPELVIDCRQARPAGDIYAVGATLYRYLTNEFPFDFGDRNKLAVVLEDDPVPLRDRAPELPAAVAEIVHRALAKDPAARFASAGAMLTALEPFSVRHKSRR